MKPFWQSDDGNLTLYNADFLELLPLLGQFDICLTDPPYGIYKKDATGFAKDRVDHGHGQWDERISNEHLEAIFAHSTNQVIWGLQYYIDHLPSTKEVWVWDKKTGDNYFADGELAWTSYDGTTRIFRHQWCGCFKDSERGIKPIHPTQKPVALMQWCLRKEDPAATIIDPMSGSGTTLIAAHRLGMKATAIEINEDHCKKTALRLTEELQQKRLPL